MERGDICPYCLDADCPSTPQTCPGRASQNHVFGDGRGPWVSLDGQPMVVLAMCGFCFGAGMHDDDLIGGRRG